MRKAEHFIKAYLVGLTMSVLLNPLTVMAQDYKFNFYNGDVTEQVEVKSKVPEVAKEVKIEKVAEKPIMNKLERTGVGMMIGYSADNFRNFADFFGTIESSSLRAGLSFVSSYDFNIDIEFLSNLVKGDLLTLAGPLELKGRVPGLSLSLRNNYWITENVAISLSGNFRGIKGTLASDLGGYYYKSYGAALSFGPTFQVGRAQFLLAYNFGLDNIQVSSKRDKSYINKEWMQNSGLKGVFAYRF